VASQQDAVGFEGSVAQHALVDDTVQAGAPPLIARCVSSILAMALAVANRKAFVHPNRNVPHAVAPAPLFAGIESNRAAPRRRVARRAR